MKHTVALLVLQTHLLASLEGSPEGGCKCVLVPRSARGERNLGTPVGPGEKTWSASWTVPSFLKVFLNRPKPP